MPTYDYECDACGHKFELFQSMKDEAERKCPECKKLKLRRLFGTGAALMFKGSGFYITDYSHKNIPTKEEKARDTAPADKPAEKAADKPAEKAPEKTRAKTEAKPAAKETSKKDAGSTPVS